MNQVIVARSRYHVTMPEPVDIDVEAESVKT